MLLTAKKNNKNSGFTLIELSIVMVIIGLIISGILIGQDLIHGAEVRGMISQMDKYSSALNSFKTKFNALPGDFSGATSYINGSTAGNGDGYIAINGTTGAYATAAATKTTLVTTAGTNTEAQGFWQQLSAMGLIEGNFTGAGTITLGTTFPLLKNNKAGIYVYSFADAGGTINSVSSAGTSNFYHLGLAPSSGTPSAQNGFSPDDARNIDVKMDDGMPFTGNIVARGGIEAAYTVGTTVGGNTCAFGAATTPAVNGSDTYNTAAGSSLQCQLRIKFN